MNSNRPIPARLTVFAAVALSAAVLAACSNGEQAAPTVNASSLNGHTFVSTEVTGHQLVPGSTVRLHFENGDLSARAGCNTMGAPYAITADELRWTGGARSTMMACDPALMSQDAWLTDFLDRGAAVTLDGPTLTLTSGATTLTLRQGDAAKN
ncbi:META domain-containing protein [Speluncibacter jeojiensis]|uniref:META domain-containing protein n=1 Tax=Speluncibacter jeojiensis TaxID=2710754 RepID=A0A9X4LZE6_9ACTN|nr:META domain-containing protein [Corynebacteriales bacterium D3-21]